MLGEVCAEVKNYFVLDNDKHVGDWKIENNIITPPLNFPTNYIRIIGSRLNDGVFEVDEMHLVDEEFHGTICVMSPPMDFLSLVNEIKSWQEVNGAADSIAMSPFNSESFGGYSYIKSGSGSVGASSVPTWQSVYANRLNRYRRICEL